jgi:hypothetical protein
MQVVLNGAPGGNSVSDQLFHRPEGVYSSLPADVLKTRYDGRAKGICSCSCSSKRKVFLILDNPPVHHSCALKDWIKEHQSEIEFFYNFICQNSIQMNVSTAS